MEINYKNKLNVGDIYTGETVTGTITKFVIEYDGVVTKVFIHLNTGVIVELGFK